MFCSAEGFWQAGENVRISLGSTDPILLAFHNESFRPFL